MAITRYTDGTTTINLGGAIEEHVRRLALATHDGALATLEAGGETVRAKAEGDWYSASGVTKRTGKSGRVEMITTIAPTEIRVAIGSRDLAKAKFVHRPGPLSVINVPATWAEWWDSLSAAEKAKFKARQKAGEFKKKKGNFQPTKEAPNPKASDGKYLLQEFVGKPTRKLAKSLNAILPTEINARMRSGRSG